MSKFIPRGLGWHRDLPDPRDYTPTHDHVVRLLHDLIAYISDMPEPYHDRLVRTRSGAMIMPIQVKEEIDSGQLTLGDQNHYQELIVVPADHGGDVSRLTRTAGEYGLLDFEALDTFIEEARKQDKTTQVTATLLFLAGGRKVDLPAPVVDGTASDPENHARSPAPPGVPRGP